MSFLHHGRSKPIWHYCMALTGSEIIQILPEHLNSFAIFRGTYRDCAGRTVDEALPTVIQWAPVVWGRRSAAPWPMSRWPLPWSQVHPQHFIPQLWQVGSVRARQSTKISLRSAPSKALYYRRQRLCWGSVRRNLWQRLHRNACSQVWTYGTGLHRSPCWLLPLLILHA